MSPSQDSWFYSDDWSKEITKQLVSFLITQKQLGNWIDVSLNDGAAAVACEQLNAMFERKYTLNNVIGRMRMLRRRWRSFQEMIVCSGVEWNKVSNKVVAEPMQWVKWSQTNPTSVAYLYQGDDLYEDLNVLFGGEVELEPNRNDALLGPNADHEDEVQEEEAPPVVVALPAVPNNEQNVEREAPEIVIISDDEDVVAQEVPVVVISSDDEAAEYDYFEVDSSEEDEIHSPTMENTLGEVVDGVATNPTIEHCPSSFDIPFWSASRTFTSRTHHNERNEYESSSDDSSSSTRTLNSRRY